MEKEGKAVGRFTQGKTLHRPTNRDTQRQMKITIEVDGADAEELIVLIQRVTDAVEKLEDILKEFEDE